MFGQHDQDNNQQNDSQQSGVVIPEPAIDGALNDDDQTSGTTVKPDDTVTSAPAIDENVANDFMMSDAPNTTPASPPAVSSTDAGSDDLLNIKQQALQHLSPLLGHLDQSPEEKFRTTMMMIQAADDQSLIKAAYEAAQGITDEKVKAQALLDIVNEINYFTQQKS